MEGRNRQNLNHSLNTQVTSYGDNTGNKGDTSVFRNRWERIGFAAENKDTIFNSLLGHFNMESFLEAYKALDKNKAVGIDRINKKEYGKELEVNLQDLISRIHKGSYKPQTKREVLIPKANGKTRPIAISCLEDKLVEWVLGKILGLIYEPLFIRNSFGFRPTKSAHGAIRTVYQSLKDNKRSNVVEIDFANFFNSIPHRKLMKILSKRISDRRFKGLIGRFLRVEILDQIGTITEPEAGTPQGSIMSPILANVYLNEVLDQWFIKNYGSYNNITVRYADDAVFIFHQKETADRFLEELGNRVQTYGLSLNEEKTGRTSFRKNESNHFHFLGFTFYWGKKPHTKMRMLKIKTHKTKLLKKIQEFYSWIKKVRCSIKLSMIWKQASAKLIGHYNYFGFRMNRHKLKHFFEEAIRSLFKWVNRRSQKSSYNWDQFTDRLKDCPLPKPPVTGNLKIVTRSFV